MGEIVHTSRELLMQTLFANHTACELCTHSKLFVQCVNSPTES